MTLITAQLLAWALRCLPVRLARQYVADFPPRQLLESGHSNSRQLLVDVSVIYQSDARTGIQRVVRALLLQLLQAPPVDFCICPVFCTRQHGYRYALPNFLDAPMQLPKAETRAVQVKNGDLFLALDLAAHLLPRHQAEVLRWKGAGVQIHVFVYDLLPLLHPEWFNLRTSRNFERWTRWIAIYADSVICISQTVKAELRTWLKARFGLTPHALPSNTIVLGADIDASAPSCGLPSNAQVLLDYMSRVPCVLMVGTIEPRKGHDQALAAFDLLWKKSGLRPSLVLVGQAGWKTKELQGKLRNHPEAGLRLFWLESVSDEFLQCLYAACRGVLVTSRAEGFGLPLIEATLKGKRVLARNLPVFQEIKVPSLSYFNCETPQGLAHALTYWLHESKSLDDISSKNNTEVIFPTWKNSASQLLQALGLQSTLQTDPYASVFSDVREKTIVPISN